MFAVIVEGISDGDDFPSLDARIVSSETELLTEVTKMIEDMVDSAWDLLSGEIWEFLQYRTPLLVIMGDGKIREAASTEDNVIYLKDREQ